MPPVLPTLCPEAAPARPSGAPEHSPAIAKAKEFVADIFRRAKEAKGGTSEEVRPPPCPGPSSSRCRLPSEPLAPGGEAVPRDSPLAAEVPASEPGYVNYTKLYYVLGSGEGTEPEDGERGAHLVGSQAWEAGLEGPLGLPPPSLPPHPAPSELEDDKISLPFVVTDLRGRNLRPMREQTAVQVGAGSGQAKGQLPGDLLGWQLAQSSPSPSARCPQGQYLTVEQLTLDFEYVINEVIRHDATWGHQFCSFSDYDIVILEVGPGVGQGRPRASQLWAALSVCVTIHTPPPRSAQKPTRSSLTLACCSWHSRPPPRRASSGEWAGTPPSPLPSRALRSRPLSVGKGGCEKPPPAHQNLDWPLHYCSKDKGPSG